MLAPHHFVAAIAIAGLLGYAMLWMSAKGGAMLATLPAGLRIMPAIFAAIIALALDLIPEAPFVFIYENVHPITASIFYALTCMILGKHILRVPRFGPAGRDLSLGCSAMHLTLFAVLGLAATIAPAAALIVTAPLEIITTYSIGIFAIVFLGDAWFAAQTKQYQATRSEPSPGASQGS